MNLFEAVDNATVNIAVSSSSQSVQIPNYSGGNQIRVYNAGTATVWIRFGGSAVVALAANDVPIAAGLTAGFSAPAAAGNTLYIAAIAAGSTGSIYFTPGEGI